MTKIKLPHISDEDRQHLSYTPNIDDLVDWIADFATQAVTEDRAQRDAQLAKLPPYNQTALELCETCGWKTLIPGEGCLNCERSTQPAWHDQPTQPGLWLCNEGDREVYTWVVYAVSSLPSRLYQPDGETRWYGPIPLPEDTK